VKNTTLADGTALKVVATTPAAPEEITRCTTEAEPNNHWHWREDAGSIGRRDGGDGTIRQIDAPLRPATGELLDHDGNQRLFRASLARHAAPTVRRGEDASLE